MPVCLYALVFCAWQLALLWPCQLKQVSVQGTHRQCSWSCSGARDAACPSFHCRRKLLPRSGASLTYLPAGDGSGEGKVLIYGGQEPVAGVIFDDLLVSVTRH